jgi:hypothetical protein
MTTQKFFSVVKASRHFIQPSIVLSLVILLWVATLLLNLLERTIEASIWAAETLTASYLELPPIPEEDTLLDDTVTKLRALSIRELKKVASQSKLPRYGSLTKEQLIEALLAHHGQG